MSGKINYLYFGAFFALLMLLCSSSVFTKEGVGGSQVFFFLYALGQVMVEIALLILIAGALRNRPWLFFSFIGATFVIFFLHIFDFLMDRILDLSVWEALNVFVLHESWGNFFYLLDASGISLWLWLAFFACLAALPFVGMALYKMTEKIAEKKSLPVSHSHFLQMALLVPVALFLWDVSASRVIDPDAYTALRKSLPWKGTFLQPKNTVMTLSGTIHPPLNEEKTLTLIAQDETVLQKKPNIYLFVVESLREDFITQEVAPHLTQFKQKALHFDRAVSGGNGSDISWFSIFFSEMSYYRDHLRNTWESGSPALQLLKKWGYQIHLYSSAELGYYGMRNLLFGKQSKLLDTQHVFPHAAPLSSADADTAALAQLQKDLKEHPDWQEGQLFIIFWDGTHFHYSWPKGWKTKFTPCAQKFAYFRAIQSQKTIQGIKNRYRNAVHYMDHLFGQFLQTLDENAVVIFMGDHGEEFLEHGHLFHNSHLTKEQTHIPLYFKFGKGDKSIEPRTVVSQADIFPSILDYIGGTVPSFLRGHSLFHQPHFPYAITARFNASCTPYEFAIHNGTYKLIAQFADRHHIFDSHQLKIISLRTDDDRAVRTHNVRDWIQQEFGGALNYLFNDGL